MYFSRKKFACWRSDKAPIEIEKEDIFTTDSVIFYLKTTLNLAYTKDIYHIKKVVSGRGEWSSGPESEVRNKTDLCLCNRT